MEGQNVAWREMKSSSAPRLTALSFKTCWSSRNAFLDLASQKRDVGQATAIMGSVGVLENPGTAMAIIPAPVSCRFQIGEFSTHSIPAHQAIRLRRL